MARLNDAPVPTESVDALKRRFIRQNRELAKNNSTQSIRIRNLEVEQSRLVVENLTLRERIIELETKLDERRRNASVQNIGPIKDKLEAKIFELSSLVAQLGLGQKPLSPKDGSKSPRLSPSLIAWRHARFVDPSAEEGRLPTISEGKHFPRRTLDAEELRRISIDASNDSPDLGPPPVAHFQDEDPITFDPHSSTATHEPDTAAEDVESDQPVASVNLETRRRRRESASKAEIKRIDNFSSPSETTESEVISEEMQPTRVGAKRKLNAREEVARTQSGDVKESFRFSRRAQPAQDITVQTDLSQKEKLENRLEAVKARTRTITERRVLASKSVNTDPVVSPRKTSRTGPADSKPEFKKPALPIRETNRPHTKEKKSKPIPAATEKAEKVLPTSQPDILEAIDIPPETPAGLDLFSPSSTNPSTARFESKDTPPPGELRSSSALGLTDDPLHAGGGRVARRARAQVNYAEPNLVSKMRRPTKEFAPAVVDKPKHAVVDLNTIDNTQSLSVHVKREWSEAQEDAWKNLPAANGQDILREEPNSPLSKKAGGSRVLEASLAFNDDKEEDNWKALSSATAMNELMASAASSSRRTSRASSTGFVDSLKPKVNVAIDDLPQRHRDDTNVFGLDTSSPEEAIGNSAAQKSSQDGLSKIRSSRRHSSISQLGIAGLGTKAGESSRLRPGKDENGISGEKPGSETGGVRSLDAAERALSRRRSMMI